MTRSPRRMDRTLRTVEAELAAPPPAPVRVDYWQSFPPIVVDDFEIGSTPLMLPFQLAGRMALQSMLVLGRSAIAATPVRWALYVLEADRAPAAGSQVPPAGRGRWHLVQGLGALTLAVAGAPARHELWLPTAARLEAGVIYALVAEAYGGGAGAALLVRPDAGDGAYTLLEAQADPNERLVDGFPVTLCPINGGYIAPFHVVLRSAVGVQAFGIPTVG